jgi:hypothetical protein
VLRLVAGTPASVAGTAKETSIPFTAAVGAGVQKSAAVAVSSECSAFVSVDAATPVTAAVVGAVARAVPFTVDVVVGAGVGVPQPTRPATPRPPAAAAVVRERGLRPLPASPLDAVHVAAPTVHIGAFHSNLVVAVIPVRERLRRRD